MKVPRLRRNRHNDTLEPARAAALLFYVLRSLFVSALCQFLECGSPACPEFRRAAAFTRNVKHRQSISGNSAPAGNQCDRTPCSSGFTPLPVGPSSNGPRRKGRTRPSFCDLFGENASVIPRSVPRDEGSQPMMRNTRHRGATTTAHQRYIQSNPISFLLQTEDCKLATFCESGGEPPHSTATPRFRLRRC